MLEYKDLSEILGTAKTRECVLQEIRRNIAVYPTFLDLKEEFQEQFIEFCMGVRGVKMTYDSFFKHIFNPEANPERLSEMLSAILGRTLTVKRALPVKHMRITEKGAMVILDIIVEFDTGELADVEVQKVGYLFPGQRASCYASDMVMRQYEREKSRRGKNFTYNDLQKVYTIVFMESSGEEFWELPEHYIHRGKVKVDTGLEAEFLQEFYFIPLDIFFDIKHNEEEETIKNDLEAWLYFLGSDRPEDILRLVNSYPRFVELYQDICKFRYHPEVAIMMFSEALRELDRNTEQYMLVEFERRVKEKTKELEEKTKKVEEKTKELEERDKKIKELDEEIKEQNKKIEELNKKLEQLEKLLAETK